MKKLLSITLAILMVISLMPTAFALDLNLHRHSVSNDCSTESGDQELFLPLDNERLENLGHRIYFANYYLTEDIIIDELYESITATTGNVNICLNGHKIISTVQSSGTSCPAIDIWDGEVSVCDCQGGGEIESVDVCVLARGDAFNTYGIKMTAVERGVSVSDGCEFNMYGGKLYAEGFAIQSADGRDVINLYDCIVGADGEAIEAEYGGTVNAEDVEFCKDLCHSQGFMGIIWKIINFFNKLFGNNPECACGKVHY